MIIARVDLGDDRLVVSLRHDGEVDIRVHRDMNGAGVFLATRHGFAIPRSHLGDLITALAAAEGFSFNEEEKVVALPSIGA